MGQNDMAHTLEKQKEFNNNMDMVGHDARLQAHLNQNRTVMFFTGNAFRPARKPRVEYSSNGAL